MRHSKDDTPEKHVTNPLFSETGHRSEHDGQSPRDGPTSQLWPLNPEVALQQGGIIKSLCNIFWI